MRDHVIAVDVGTASARAGVFDAAGNLLARRECPILLRRPGAERGEHDSEDIWQASCKAVAGALAASGITAGQVASVGFDATCSLVLRAENGSKIALAEEDGIVFDTMSWLDHRASAEAEECTRTSHPALAHCGEVMSPEMQVPKLMWLKRQRPDLWASAGLFFDLADFLTWRATGSPARSLCTLTAKWNYLAHEGKGWKPDFFSAIGLDDLVARGGLPEQGVAVGRPVGVLSPWAAAEMGLDPGIAVAAGMVDAYAGALGVLGPVAADPGDLSRQAALIAGTSSCLVAFAPEPRFGRSIWGPFFEAIFPGQWLVEAGQSATGGLLGHLLLAHAEGGGATTAAHQRVIARIMEMRAEEGARFGERINILPDFHGNRSPFADDRLTGTIAGLTLDASFDGLCRIYWRACVSIALGLRQILETLETSGFRPERLHLTGGHVRNPLLVELYADVTRLEIAVTRGEDAVLLGTAMNAATAAGLFSTLAEAGVAMARPVTVIRPNPATRSLYDRDFARFLAMQRHRAELDAL
ncbi:FGGY-family pentulose kinase [Ciceribacter lividus]|uniref:FGGY-family pentulose kinase n=1 Tax=Ciceribacter lividus TaxID=1197950 RepID=A0A6I7HKQ2_9HYPH|nr:FGGY-family carbohydrate kinase [Ciceribacter lividus]RCW21076.1 FGGY-family pentulose kinase [Ciceribacter lividus]